MSVETSHARYEKWRERTGSDAPPWIALTTPEKSNWVMNVEPAYHEEIARGTDKIVARVPFILLGILLLLTVLWSIHSSGVFERVF